MAGLSSCLALLVAGLVWLVVDDDPYVAPGPGSGASSARPDQAATVLQDLVVAVEEGDVAAAEALAPDGNARARTFLRGVVENAERLRVEDFSLRYVDELGAVTADGAWSGAVDTTWAFAGFDDEPARTEVRFRFVDDGDGVALVGAGGGDRRTPLWLTGPVQVRRGPGSLVLVDGTRASADAYARLARAAVPTVRRVVTGWRPRLVVEVPDSTRGLDAALASEPGRYDAIAAVTSTVDGSLAPGAPVHVFVNPAVFDGLEERGAQVVMSHEAVHVATGAATADVPLWLLEGFADYVALRDIDLPLSVTARQVARQVSEDGPPTALPGPAEFDTATVHLGAAYEAAWLACRLIAAEAGEEALVATYERVSAGEPLEEVLPDETGLTVAELTRAWRRQLLDLARAAA